MDISGIVHKKLALQSGQGKTGSEWKKIDFILETQEQYPKKICFTAWGERVSDVERLREGEKVKVHFDLSSREYNEKWYSEIKAWKIEKGGDTDEPARETNYDQSSNTNSGFEKPAPASSSANIVEDDLPF